MNDKEKLEYINKVLSGLWPDSQPFENWTELSEYETIWFESSDIDYILTYDHSIDKYYLMARTEQPDETPEYSDVGEVCENFIEMVTRLFSLQFSRYFSIALEGAMATIDYHTWPEHEQNVCCN